MILIVNGFFRRVQPIQHITTHLTTHLGCNQFNTDPSASEELMGVCVDDVASLGACNPGTTSEMSAYCGFIS